jgi:mannose-6-phosphate isomerase
MLKPGGPTKDATQRIWAQAEYLRALTLRPDSEDAVLRQLRALQQRFLHSGGWYECRDQNGDVSRQDMPSTTPYHLATCYRSLVDYLG